MPQRPGERDFRDGTVKGTDGRIERKARGSSDEDTTLRWWDKKGLEAAQSVTSAVKRLQQQQEPRIRNMVTNARVYGNISNLSVGSSLFGKYFQAQAAQRRYATYNATSSAIDTLVSHIGETKPRPYYLTSGGNYRQQRQAKKLTQFSDGFFYETNAYREGPVIFRDGAVWGDGFDHVYVRGGKLHKERVTGAELWCDDVEGQYGSPRNLHRVKQWDRDDLIAFCGANPANRDAIGKAQRSRETTMLGSNLSDMVTSVESWRLPVLNEDGELEGGWYAMTLAGGESAMLVEPKEWKHEFFPFARFQWCRALEGFWSHGGAEQVRNEQMWLNELFWTVQKTMRLAGTVKVAMEHGSKLVDEHINNEIGSVLKHSPGKPPVFFTAAPVHESFFMEMREGVERIYKKLGVSELAASNMKPAGLDSKPALREYKDTQNERHKTTAEAYDDYYMQLARIARCLARDIKGYKVRVPGASGFRVIDYDDLKKSPDESIVLQMFPVSQLPRDPAGRTQTIQEWVQAGWLTPRQGRKLMDFPDLQSANTLADAQEELVLETLDRIVDAEEGDDDCYRPPEPTDDLALCKETVLHYIQLYRRLELEPAKLELLRNWNQQVDALLAKAMAPPPGTGMPTSGAQSHVPQGQPPAAPTAELLPQAA